MQCELKNCSPSSSETTTFITLGHGGTAIGEVTATRVKSAWKSLIQKLFVSSIIFERYRWKKIKSSC